MNELVRELNPNSLLYPKNYAQYSASCLQKQSNVQINNKPPQPHKIEAQEIKNLQQLVELQKPIHKPPNL
jgi:hypothetical protein